MEKAKAEWTDQKVEGIIGNMLRYGVLLSALVVAFGGARYLWHYGRVRPSYRVFHGEPTDLRSISGVIRFTLAGHRQGIIQSGLLLLIATPVARVLFSVYAFARERDWLYVVITLIVLAVLLYSLMHGE